MKLKIYYIGIFLMLCSFSDVCAQCDTDDYQALRALYLSTEGPVASPNGGWDNAADWQAVDWSNPITPPPGCDLCSLNGITCVAGRVTNIPLI